MKVIVTIVSKLVYNLLQGLITYLYRGEITQVHPVPTMDIPVGHDFMGPMGPRCPKNMPKEKHIHEYLGCDIGGAKEPGVIYFPSNWGAKEPQNLPNHRVGI